MIVYKTHTSATETELDTITLTRYPAGPIKYAKKYQSTLRYPLDNPLKLLENYITYNT